METEMLLFRPMTPTLRACLSALDSEEKNREKKRERKSREALGEDALECLYLLDTNSSNRIDA